MEAPRETIIEQVVLTSFLEVSETLVCVYSNYSIFKFMLLNTAKTLYNLHIGSNYSTQLTGEDAKLFEKVFLGFL